MRKIKVGDTVRPKDGRKSSNDVLLHGIKTAEVIKTGVDGWTGRKTLVIKVSQDSKPSWKGRKYEVYNDAFVIVEDEYDIF